VLCCILVVGINKEAMEEEMSSIERDVLFEVMTEAQGKVLSPEYVKYLMGLITRDEFDAFISLQTDNFKKASAELRAVSDQCISLILLTLEGDADEGHYETIDGPDDTQ